jgi:REP element-mobilizing transposase RayT
MLGYMVTWSTYGAWLQGDVRGWVKGGKIRGEQRGLEEANRWAMKGTPVLLGRKEREAVRVKIEETAGRMGQHIYAIAVRSNHVHVVVGDGGSSIVQTVMRYKMASTLGLQKTGFVGKVWARGYDKRFCFSEEELDGRIEYVVRHNAGR